jgi:hypothetical protein
MQTNQNDANIRSFYDLINLYADELLTTTSWMTGRSGPIRKVIQAELKAGRRVCMVTFNHDLLIENALALMPSVRYGRVWCLRHAYGFPEGTPGIANASATFDYACPGGTDEHVPILKLHGSVNWVFRTLRSMPPAEASRRRRELLICTNRSLPPHIRRLRGSGRRWYLWSLIVPPIYEKHGYIRNELRDTWERAASVLSTAGRVIFWGYSFPRADPHARYLFQAAAQVNPSALRRPILINPDPEAHRALWNVLQPRHVEHYRDVRPFLERFS